MIIGNPMMMGAGIEIDPYWSYVEWLLQPRTGDSGVVDRGPAGLTATVNGTLAIVAASGGAGAAYDFVPANSNQIKFSGLTALSTGEWTLEAIVNYDNIGGTFSGIISNSSSDVNGPRIVNDSGATTVGGHVTPGSRTTSSLSNGTNYHVALCRDGQTVRLFLDGAQQGTDLTDLTDYAVTDWVLGTYRINLEHYLDGKIIAARLTRGLGRYAANFTPPTRFPETGG